MPPSCRYCTLGETKAQASDLARLRQVVTEADLAQSCSPSGCTWLSPPPISFDASLASLWALMKGLDKDSEKRHKAEVDALLP